VEDGLNCRRILSTGKLRVDNPEVLQLNLLLLHISFAVLSSQLPSEPVTHGWTQKRQINPLEKWGSVTNGGTDDGKLRRFAVHVSCVELRRMGCTQEHARSH
jgi:hypothetical protein